MLAPEGTQNHKVCKTAAFQCSWKFDDIWVYLYCACPYRLNLCKFMQRYVDLFSRNDIELIVGLESVNIHPYTSTEDFTLCPERRAVDKSNDKINFRKVPSKVSHNRLLQV